MTLHLRLSPPAAERLESRLAPATTAVFAFGVLAVSGDGEANDIVVRSVDGVVQVTDDGQPVPIRSFGGAPALARTRAVAVAGLGGDDTLTVDASLGAVPAALSGGAGNDALMAQHTGSSLLSGDGGEDTIQGGGGNDVLLGGAGNDDLNGGAGIDFLYGGFGDDELDGGGTDGGRDVLVGGPGADTFNEHDGEDDVFLDFNAEQGDVVV
jgi:Ca2+-binding RTX toxin-like protein